MDKKAVALTGLGGIVVGLALGYSLGIKQPPETQNIGSRVESAEQETAQPAEQNWNSNFSYNGAHLKYTGSLYPIARVFAEYGGKTMELKPHIFKEDYSGSYSLFNVPDELLRADEFRIYVRDKSGNQSSPNTIYTKADGFY